jgi:hypothetical protein
MTRHYIDNKRFEELIVLYLEDRKTYEEELFSMFDLLVSNVMGAFNFDVDPEDAKQDCFNFFTTVIVNNLKLVYTKDKKYAEKIKAFEELQGYRAPTQP